MISLAGRPQHEALLKDQVSIDDDTETVVVDVGALSSSTVEIIQSVYGDLTLNGQSNVDFNLYVDINGSLVAIGGTKNVNSNGGLDVEQLFDVGIPIASARVQLTVTGATADPGTPGTLDYTVEHLIAT